MRTTLFLLLVAARAAAQDASPYVPLQHWAMPYVEHLIAAGVMADPTPLTRPLKQADVVRALGTVDTLAAAPSVRGTVRQLLAAFAHSERGPFGRIDGDLGVAAATYARRDPLAAIDSTGPRQAGPKHGYVSGGLAVQLLFGPVVAVTHPYFDTRLKYDPEFFGKKDRIIAGRNAEAYVSAQWRYGEVFFGSLDRNWGPPAADGLLVSSSPYSYDHFGLTIGTPGIHLQAILTQLDDLPDATGVANHRYFVAHRVVLRPPGATTVGLWEGSILAGPNRQLEPWYANVLSLGLLAQYDRGTTANNQLGLDIQSRIARITVFGQLLIDDIQIDRSDPGDQEPTAYALTVGAQGGVRTAGVAWTAFYTQVANLTYRTPNPTETVMSRGVGLARNFSDYDQLTLRGSLLAAPGVLLAPEITVLRQGEGDFRLPYPPVAAFGTTKPIFSGVVERTVRLALGASVQRAAWGVAGSGGVHLISNAGHVTGVTKTRWVGALALSYRFHRSAALP